MTQAITIATINSTATFQVDGETAWFMGASYRTTRVQHEAMAECVGMRTEKAVGAAVRAMTSGQMERLPHFAEGMLDTISGFALRDVSLVVYAAAELVSVYDLYEYGRLRNEVIDTPVNWWAD